MKTKLDYLKNFKDQMVIFLDELIEQFPTEPIFIFLRIFVKDKIPIKILVDQFITDVLPHENLIKNRDELFFTNTQLIGYPNKPKFFHDFWFSDYLDKNDKEIIWKWIDVFVILAKKIQQSSSN